MSLKSYRELDVWNVSMELVEEIYRQTSRFPAEERFGLTNQMRKAAVSIPSNIAEGYGRIHRKEYIHFLSIAHGSLRELETQVIISGRLQFLEKANGKKAWELTQDVGKMLTAMIKSLS